MKGWTHSEDSKKKIGKLIKIPIDIQKKDPKKYGKLEEKMVMENYQKIIK